MESTLKFQRGDIYFIRLDSSTGSEQSGTRPAVILQNDVGNTYSPTLIVATLTSKTEKTRSIITLKAYLPFVEINIQHFSFLMLFESQSANIGVDK